MGVYDQIRKAFQDLVAPELHALRGDLRVLDQRVVSLNEKVDGLDARPSRAIEDWDARLTEKVESLDEKIDRLEICLTERTGGLDVR